MLEKKECPYTEINKEIEQSTGFKIEDHNIELYGLCKTCKNKGVLEI